MVWKLKYLKYKTKYLNLKNKNLYGGQTNYLETLKKLYPNCVKNSAESKDKTHTYGEMEYEGVEVLYDEIKQLNPNIEYFMDIGSGRGKLPCWFAGQENIVKSVGIEIVNERCLDAEKLKSDLAREFPNLTEKINLVCDDFSSCNLDSLVDSNPNTLVWISNLCFGPELTTKLFKQILSQMVHGTIITCSVKPSNESLSLNFTDDNMLLKKLEFIKTTKIQMSWWENLSDVHIYKIV